jgi:hypothetical protein
MRGVFVESIQQSAVSFFYVIRNARRGKASDAFVGGPRNSHCRIAYGRHGGIARENRAGTLATNRDSEEKLNDDG